ncbi:MAG: glutamate--tRNA ligase [Patescibacteria group bacterium]
MSPSPKKGIRVRFAPSPTGQLHLGNARTALFNWFFARGQGGKFILRIEDTDTERSEEKFEKEIIELLSWLGLDWDEGPDPKNHKKDLGDFGPYRQSQRIGIYKKYLEKLLSEKQAYWCYCAKEELDAQREAMTAEGLPQKYNGHCRDITAPPKGKEPQVIRFVVPEIEAEFKDLIRGRVKFDAALFGDIVIAKNLDSPLYNFAVVVDDALMGITHVIRGEDHISNTPKQLLIQKALGFETPIYAHIPLILAPDRSKLSKRKSETSLLSYREKGYLPEATVNFLALLGWHPEGSNEIFSLKELARLFDIGRVQKSGAIFNEEKLRWMNNQYVRKLTNEEILDLLGPSFEKHQISAPRDFILRIIEIEKERLQTLEDFFIETDFFFELPNYEVNLLKWKDQSLPDAEIALSKIKEVFSSISELDFRQEVLSSSMAKLAEGRSRGEVFWPLRTALSGKVASPDPLIIAEILGKNEVLRRVSLGIQKISE